MRALTLALAAASGAAAVHGEVRAAQQCDGVGGARQRAACEAWHEIGTALNQTGWKVCSLAEGKDPCAADACPRGLGLVDCTAAGEFVGVRFVRENGLAVVDHARLSRAFARFAQIGARRVILANQLSLGLDECFRECSDGLMCDFSGSSCRGGCAADGSCRQSTSARSLQVGPPFAGPPPAGPPTMPPLTYSSVTAATRAGPSNYPNHPNPFGPRGPDPVGRPGDGSSGGTVVAPRMPVPSGLPTFLGRVGPPTMPPFSYSQTVSSTPPKRPGPIGRPGTTPSSPWRPAGPPTWPPFRYSPTTGMGPGHEAGPGPAQRPGGVFRAYSPLLGARGAKPPSFVSNYGGPQEAQTTSPPVSFPAFPSAGGDDGDDDSDPLYRPPPTGVAAGPGGAIPRPGTTNPGVVRPYPYPGPGERVP